MNDYRNEIISKVIGNLEIMITELKNVLESKTDKHLIVQIQKYHSNSGNITWKCINEGDEVVSYIRQSHKGFWMELGHWDKLHSMRLHDIYDCSIEIGTIREGDFNRIVEVDSFELNIPDLSEENEYPF